MEGASILPHIGVEQEQYRENLKPSDWIYGIFQVLRGLSRAGILVANGPVAQLVRASDS